MMVWNTNQGSAVLYLTGNHQDDLTHKQQHWQQGFHLLSSFKNYYCVLNYFHRKII